MPTSTTAKRLLLRAEIVSSGWSVIGHTLEISDSWIFVRTNETAYIGDRMTLRLSFPGLLEPFELEGHVVSQQLPAEPGEPYGMTLALVFRNDAEEQKLRSLLRDTDEDDASAAKAQPLRVLVVEDSRLLQEVFAAGMAKFFRRRGNPVEVDFSSTVEEGWERSLAQRYDLIIIDYYLPEQLGEELIARLRQHSELNSIPIIAVSVGGETARDATLRAGADMFLDKPLVFRDLYATIDRLTPKKESQ